MFRVHLKLQILLLILGFFKISNSAKILNLYESCPTNTECLCKNPANPTETKTCSVGQSCYYDDKTLFCIKKDLSDKGLCEDAICTCKVLEKTGSSTPHYCKNGEVCSRDSLTPGCFSEGIKSNEICKSQKGCACTPDGKFTGAKENRDFCLNEETCFSDGEIAKCGSALIEEFYACKKDRCLCGSSTKLVPSILKTFARCSESQSCKLEQTVGRYKCEAVLEKSLNQKDILCLEKDVRIYENKRLSCGKTETCASLIFSPVCVSDTFFVPKEFVCNDDNGCVCLFAETAQKKFQICLKGEKCTFDSSTKSSICQMPEARIDIQKDQFCWNLKGGCKCTINGKSQECYGGTVCRDNKGEAKCEVKNDVWDCWGKGACDCTTFGSWSAAEPLCLRTNDQNQDGKYIANSNKIQKTRIVTRDAIIAEYRLQFGTSKILKEKLNRRSLQKLWLKI